MTERLRRVLLSTPLVPLMYGGILAALLAHYAWWSVLGLVAELRVWRTGSRYSARERASIARWSA